MELREQQRELYEEKLRPYIQDLDKDPFMSRDISIEPDAAVGYILHRVSKAEEYSLELIDRWPYVFSTEGNSAEDLNKDKVDARDQHVLDRMVQVLESEGKISDDEVYDTLNYLVDWYNNKPAEMEKKGQIREDFKNLAPTKYKSEESTFHWGKNE